ncbi:CreA family protein [Methylomagnum ishizawai]|uniref:CreA family protein n=1 Tax=Methylomagnum ishizawai TaxID=1760988 RepID=UPI0020CB6197|nr:CreA family protein [Methylomagnum ishizawai]
MLAGIATPVLRAEVVFDQRPFFVAQVARIAHVGEPWKINGGLTLHEFLFARQFLKSTNIKRMYDKTRNVLVYLAISRKVIEGAPANSVSAVAIQPWVGAR